MAEIANSSFLDLTAWRQTSKDTVGEAFGFDENSAYDLDEDYRVNVGIMLKRLDDPTKLLDDNWASRQNSLSQMQSSGTIWTSYGSDPNLYNDVVSKIKDKNIKLLDDKHGWASSAESRTVWMSVNSEEFEWLFGQKLKYAEPEGTGLIYWNGKLKSEHSWSSDISGIWIDSDYVYAPTPKEKASSVTLPQGSQSIGNALDHSEEWLQKYPSKIADLYNFPITDEKTTTSKIGLLEPGVGIALYEGEPSEEKQLIEDFNDLVHAYRKGNNTNRHIKVYADGYSESDAVEDDGGERSLDVGVATLASPGSDLVIYGGPKDSSTPLATYQSAIWSKNHSTNILSTSWGETVQSSPNSPFKKMYDEIYTDGALKNISFMMAVGDSGSNGQSANGVPNIEFGQSSPYIINVGGTSITLSSQVGTDSTLEQITSSALDGNQNTLKQLIEGGLKYLPVDAPDISIFVETVWNTYFLTKDHLKPGYIHNQTGSGGIDPREPAPAYQSSYGLNLIGAGPFADKGRGVPDVSALAGGNLYYTVPNSNMEGTTDSGGTSAAAPLWAALTAQLNSIFNDQGLPVLGYYNDLLYNAAAIAPGSFNDITIGNNISTYVDGGSIKSGGTSITPTGYGYQAGPDYDLTTGLGTPNGLLLARALTAIAHAQMSSDAPALLDQAAYGSAANQHLLVQATLQQSQEFGLAVAGSSTSYTGTATNSLAWNSAFAQKTMQADFDPALVRLFDSAAQGTASDLSVAAGNSLAVTLGGSTVAASRAVMTSPFGFVDYKDTAGNSLRLARAVAIAQTAGGADDQQAVVRLRQNTTDDMTIAFYRVDDLDGTIDGLAPGQAGYDAAVTGRLYTTTTGGTAVAGPGYGLYTQALLSGVDSGDLIAMTVTSGPYDKTATSVTHDFYGFSAANETVDGSPVTHLWNYGLNTWGWEGTYGGGDQDYNDLVVQLDFTSASGSGWLVQDPSTGSEGDDASYGDNGANTVTAAAGEDTVYGAAGLDTLFGGTGDDLVSGQDGNDFVGVGAGNDFGSGGWGNDEVHGEEGNDLLFGDDGNDGVYGEDGDDLVYGGTGNDYLTGDAGNDRVFGQDGDDRVFGGEGDDDLSGGAGADTIEGGAGTDLLFGNAGDDVLTGGAGADVFAFGTGDGFDRILDFVLGGPEADVIAFNGGAFADFAAVQAASRQEGSDVVIAYGAGDALTLAGVQLGSLSAANFTFA